MLIIGVAHIIIIYVHPRELHQNTRQVYCVKAGYPMQIVATDILGSLLLKTIGKLL